MNFDARTLHSLASAENEAFYATLIPHVIQTCTERAQSGNFSAYFSSQHALPDTLRERFRDFMDNNGFVVSFSPCDRVNRSSFNVSWHVPDARA
jgi:hypothetical protein